MFRQTLAAALTAALLSPPAGLAQSATTAVILPGGFSAVGFSTLSADDLNDLPLYDQSGTEIGRLHVSAAEPDVLVADVGTWLGQEGQAVLLEPGHLHVFRNASGETRGYVTIPKEEISGLPLHPSTR